MKSSSRGFTLIELLVVIAIIGILSSVVLASLNSARTKGRDARRLQDLKQIQIALELYYDSSGTKEYPEEVSNKVPATALAPYIATVPVDPKTGLGYDYNNLTAANGACAAASAVCPNYVLGANLDGTVPPDVDGTFPIFSCADGTPPTQNKYCLQP